MTKHQPQAYVVMVNYQIGCWPLAVADTQAEAEAYITERGYKPDSPNKPKDLIGYSVEQVPHLPLARRKP